MPHSPKADIALKYLERVRARGDGLDDLLPGSFKPNWKDQPLKFKVYPGAPLIFLPEPSQSQTTRDALTPSGSFCERLSVLLHFMSSLMGRKLRVNWNDNWRDDMAFARSQYSRAAASGGGLYPTETYLCLGPGEDLVPGIYHVNGIHDALVPLRVGNYSREVSCSLLTTNEGSGFQHFLVLTVDFWKNCFKYHGFGYHVCSEDIGAALQNAMTVSSGLDLRSAVWFWFDDQKLNRLLGLNSDQESVFVVIGIGPEPDAPPLGVSSSTEESQVPKAWQRSKNTQVPSLFCEMHQSALFSEASRPELKHNPYVAPPIPHTGLGDSAGDLSKRIIREYPKIARDRKSSWGGMTRAHPIPVEHLADVFRYMISEMENLSSDCTGVAKLIRLRMMAQGVSGLTEGVYLWDARAQAFLPESKAPGLYNWQEGYSMLNYNWEQIGCLAFLCADFEQVFAQLGNRGLRILDAYIGVAAQAAYTACAALDLQCGAVLGVRTRVLNDALGVSLGEDAILGILIGHGTPDVQMFDFSLG